MADPGKLVRKLAEVGPVYGAVLALRRILPARLLRYSRCSLYALDTDAAAALEPIAARWADASDRELLTGFGHRCEEVDERIARGSLACVIASGGRLSGYVWFQPGEFLDAELRTRFRMREGEIWLYDAMIASELRGQGLYPRLLAAAAALLRQRGYRRIWIQIDDLNRNSISAHCAAGAVARGRASILEVCGLARVADERGARWLGAGGARLREPG